jgi:hypothetical protein
MGAVQRGSARLEFGILRVRTTREIFVLWHKFAKYVVAGLSLATVSATLITSPSVAGISISSRCVPSSRAPANGCGSARRAFGTVKSRKSPSSPEFSPYPLHFTCGSGLDVPFCGCSEQLRTGNWLETRVRRGPMPRGEVNLGEMAQSLVGAMRGSYGSFGARGNPRGGASRQVAPVPAKPPKRPLCKTCADRECVGDCKY